MDTAVTQAILSGPNKLTGKEGAQYADDLFDNFVAYAKSNWTYHASGKENGKVVLETVAKHNINCRGIAHALNLMFRENLKIEAKEQTINGFFWTNPEFECFDSNVVGCVARAETPSAKNEGCIFNNHYFSKCNGKFYDPCMTAQYDTETELVLVTLKHITEGIKSGPNYDCILVRVDAATPGFSSYWVKITQKEHLKTYVQDKAKLIKIAELTNHLAIGEIVKEAKKMLGLKYRIFGR